MPEVGQSNGDFGVEFRTVKFVRIADCSLLAGEQIGACRPDVPPKLDGTLFWFVEEGALVQSNKK